MSKNLGIWIVNASKLVRVYIVTFILCLCRWFVNSHLLVLRNHVFLRCLQSSRIWSHENPIRFLGWNTGFHCSTAANWHHEWGRVFLNEGCETLLLKYARLSVRAHCLPRRRHSASAARAAVAPRPARPPAAARARLKLCSRASRAIPIPCLSSHPL